MSITDLKALVDNAFIGAKKLPAAPALENKFAISMAFLKRIIDREGPCSDEKIRTSRNL
jgi:hypothetical protein